jgi:hypothetical protein
MVTPNRGEKRKSLNLSISISAIAAPNSAPQYVTKLNPNDILLGRGAPVINYQGNIRFRELVNTRKAEYISSGRHQVKDEIARQIIEEIGNRQGRFLHKIESITETQQRISVGTRVWQVAAEDVAIEKVKQALRDKDPLKLRSDDPIQSASNVARAAGESDRGSHNLQGSLQAGTATMHLLDAANNSLTASGLQRARHESANPAAQLIFQQQQEYGLQQQLALLHQQRLHQQYLARLQQQQQQQRTQLSGLLMNQLKGGPHQRANEGLLALRRQEAAWSVLNQQMNPSIAPMDLNVRSPEEIRPEQVQLRVLTMLREQQQLDRNMELIMRNQNVLSAVRLPPQLGIPLPFGLAGAVSPPPTVTIGSVLLSRLQQQATAAAAVSSPPASQLLVATSSNNIASPLPPASVAKLPSPHAATSSSSSSSEEDPNRTKANTNQNVNSTDASLSSSSTAASSCKEGSGIKKPRARG